MSTHEFLTELKNMSARYGYRISDVEISSHEKFDMGRTEKPDETRMDIWFTVDGNRYEFSGIDQDDLLRSWIIPGMEKENGYFRFTDDLYREIAENQLNHTGDVIRDVLEINVGDFTVFVDGYGHDTCVDVYRGEQEIGNRFDICRFIEIYERIMERLDREYDARFFTEMMQRSEY